MKYRIIIELETDSHPNKWMRQCLDQTLMGGEKVTSFVIGEVDEDSITNTETPNY